MTTIPKGDYVAVAEHETTCPYAARGTPGTPGPGMRTAGPGMRTAGAEGADTLDPRRVGVRGGPVPNTTLPLGGGLGDGLPLLASAAELREAAQPAWGGPAAQPARREPAFRGAQEVVAGFRVWSSFA